MIYLGSDHAGYQLKESIKKFLAERKIAYDDLGVHADEPADYPDYAFAVAEKVASSRRAGGEDFGILFCGSGIGMDIAANKVKGARAALALDEYMGRQAREHDDANILVLAGRVMDEAQAAQVTQAFLEARFDEGENHVRRLQKIRQYEEQ